MRKQKSQFIPKENAGYKIINHEVYDYTKEQDNMLYEYAIAIAEMDTSRGTQYVTWEFTTVSQNDTLLTRSFFWGHYFENSESALWDYHERLSSYYRMHSISVKAD